MYRSVFRRPIGILVLGGALAAPSLADDLSTSPLLRLRWPQALWDLGTRLGAVWEENGSSIDPYGRELREQVASPQNQLAAEARGVRQPQAVGPRPTSARGPKSDT
jgi:hypothetical protein